MLVKIGMLSNDKRQGQKFTLLSHDLLKPWDAIRDGRGEPLNSLRGLPVLGASLPGLRLGGAGAQHTGSLLLCSVGYCPSHGLALVDGYLSCGLGQSQSQDMVGGYSLDGKGKDLLAGSGQGRLGFILHHRLDELPMTTPPSPKWIWD